MDSTKARNKYVVGGDKKKKDSDSGGGKGKVTVVDLAAQKEKDQRDYEKRIKLIEVCDTVWPYCIYSIGIRRKYFIHSIYMKNKFKQFSHGKTGMLK